MTDPWSPPTTMPVDPQTLANQAYQQGTSSANGFSTQYPYSPYQGQTAPVGVPFNGISARTRYHSNPSTRYAAAKDSLITGDQHMAQFNTLWNTDATWRTKLMTYAQAAGLASASSSAIDYMNAWDKAGQYSSYWAQAGIAKQTPMEVLAWLSSKDGKTPDFGAGTGKAFDSTRSTVNIADPQSAYDITQTVMQAALGRKADQHELASYYDALTAYARSNPTVTKTHTDAYGNQTTTQTGGTDLQGFVQAKVGNTAAAQAYQTNNVFNGAMKILAGL